MIQMLREDVARVAHEINKAYCESMGDTSQPEWKDAPYWQRESAIKGVDTHLANPEMTPEESHNSWMEHKLKEGWVFGEIKDPEKKTHPCLVAYWELPPEQRAKDYIFKEVVASLRDLDERISSDKNESSDEETQL